VPSLPTPPEGRFSTNQLILISRSIATRILANQSQPGVPAAIDCLSNTLDDHLLNDKSVFYGTCSEDYFPKECMTLQFHG